MKSWPRLIVTGICAALLLTGCQQADRAKTATPTLEELPYFEEPVTVSTANVGVEGRTATRRMIVPRYEKIEPTPEEKKILGIKEEPELDALVLYRPAPSPEQGISAESLSKYGVCNIGGMTVGTCPAEQRYSNYGYAGRYYAASIFGREGAAAGFPTERRVSVGLPWTMSVGECFPRQPAAREKRRTY